ncbi:hypothetical protein LguiB_024222 [Lonicera macranthoides]
MEAERSAPTNNNNNSFLEEDYILRMIREEWKRRKSEKLDQHLETVDYHLLRSEDEYNDAISKCANVVVVCLNGEFNPFAHLFQRDLDCYGFVDVVAKNHKEARFLIADSVSCPELVDRLNPDGVYMGFAAIKKGERQGFVTMSEVCDWSGDGDNDVPLAKLLGEVGVITGFTATESEKNHQPVDADDDDDDSFYF